MNGALDLRPLQRFCSSSHRESQRLLDPAPAAGAAEASFPWALSADGVFAFAQPFLQQQTAKPPNGDAPRVWRAATMPAATQTGGFRV